MDDGEYTETYIRETSKHLQSLDVSISRLVEVFRTQRLPSPTRPRFEQATSDRSESGSEHSHDEEQDQDDDSQEVECVLQARRCDLTKYRELIKGQPRPVLDYLVAGDQLDNEMSVWEERNAAILPPIRTDFREKDRQESRTQPREATIPKDSTEHSWIRSIRINSAIVIRMLGQLAADEDISMPQTFEQQPLVVNRPFSFLIHHQKNMKIRLSNLREHLESPEESQDISQDAPLGSFDQDMALKQVQCYVDFVEDNLIPEAKTWKRPDELKQQQPRIRFEDLWYLFQLGDLVYVPPMPRSPTSGRLVSAYQSITRVHALQQPERKSMNGGPTNLTYDPVEQTTGLLLLPQTDDRGKHIERFSVCVYHIEFDGEVWAASSRCIFIDAFGGERDITTLPVFPLHFKSDYEEILGRCLSEGKAMVNLIQDRFGFYSGWSLINTPLGRPVDDGRGRSVRNPTHIESDVLVDFSEAYNTSPSWRPGIFGSGPTVFNFEGSIGWRKTSPNVEWADTRKTNAKLRTKGRVVHWDGVDTVRASSYWRCDQYLRSPRVKMPSGEDFALIPRRFYGYSVWERRFFHLDIRYLQPKDTADSARAFNQLQIAADDKQLIQSLVHSHFHKKAFQAKHGIELQGQDLIRGKGKGLVILLHGVPGVGKTATAEAVAQKWQKPLFPITCGDLGITAEKVEKALNEIFRLAHLWDCVLLLDEADVFITHRVKVGDLQRNGLVSVFLRMLEYYNGILFLTTNRPGVLDEAVKSRVHLALKYNHLDLLQTEALFEFNMQRLKEIEDNKGALDPEYRKLHLRKKEILAFAREHYEKSMAEQGFGRWNGRQIRNAFLIAASLAHYGDGEEGEEGLGEDEELQKQLGRSHFEKVDKTTLLYDQYRREMFNKDDDLRAHEKEER